MNKELCFIIENINIYLEQVLVDYMDIPIFFLCKGEEQYYLALCTDLDELSYIVEKLSLSDVYNLLHGKIPMRDIILKQNEYWDIVSGNEICLDVVTKKSIEVIDDTCLPETNAFFEILTKQIKLYVQKFDDDFFADKYFSESNKKVDLSALVSMDIIFRDIEQFIGLVDCKVEKPAISRMPLYDEKMDSIKTEQVIFRSSEQSQPIHINDLFELVESDVNKMAIAA